jgi:hypothetical protein
MFTSGTLCSFLVDLFPISVLASTPLLYLNAISKLIHNIGGETHPHVIACNNFRRCKCQCVSVELPSL